MAWKKLVLQKILLQQTELTVCFHPRHASERNSELLSLPRNGSERNFERLLNHSTVKPKELPKDLEGKNLKLYHRYKYSTRMLIVFFCGIKYSFIYLLLILFHSTEFRAFFSSAERFGTEFREFSVSRNSRNSAGTNKLFRLFRLPRNNFYVGNCQPRPNHWTPDSPIMLLLVDKLDGGPDGDGGEGIEYLLDSLVQLSDVVHLQS